MVILGDSAQSKILPNERSSLPTPPLKSSPKYVKQPPPSPDAIAIKPKVDKVVKPKPVDITKSKKLFANDLLADIQKAAKLKKQFQQKQMAQLQKMLHEQAERTLREQLQEEAIQLKAKQKREAQGEINKYQALILQAISENWIVPVGANRRLTCELMIRITASGMVLNVDVLKTSGDVELDRSARAAVLKASPLPVPKNPEAFAAFKQFVLKVKPENVITQDNGFETG